MVPRALRLRVSLLLAATLPLAGCASVWQASYTPAPEVSPDARLVARWDGPVRIRSVPWDRVQATLESIEAQVAASNVHPEDWPPDRRTALQAELLRGLQVSEPPGSVAVLGRSDFRSTDAIRPADGELEKFARSIGADTVVWTSRPLGLADKVVQEPVSTYTNGSCWTSGPRRDRRGRSDAYTENTTTFVPVVVRANESAYLAFYLATRQGPAPEGHAPGGR